MFFSRSLRFSSFFGLIGTVLLLSVTLGTSPASGQYWRQTTRVVTPVEAGALRAFLDTVLHRIEEQNLAVRRAPKHSDRPLSALRSTLIEEHGIGVTTANTVLIRYEFRIDVGDHLQRNIRSLQFQLRSPSPGPYIRVLHIDARKPWVQDLLSREGTHLSTNEAALIPFRQRLRFPRLIDSEATQIVEIGGTVVRDGFASKKAAFVQKLEQLMYGGLFSVTGSFSEQFAERRSEGASRVTGQDRTTAMKKAPASSQ